MVKDFFNPCMTTGYMGYWPGLFGQDGWILAKSFFCGFMDRDVETKNEANNQPS